MKRTIVVGAGNMGSKWLRTVRDHPDTEPVGLVDLDVELARVVADKAALTDLVVGADLVAVAEATAADIVVDATVPAAHRDVTVAALRSGLAVLGEKPAAATLAEAIALAALAEETGGIFVVSQSRRFNAQLAAARRWLGRGARIGGISARFSRGPRFGGFRDEMESPLLVDMAIHLFDMARWFVDADPVAVYARESNPSWSWYRGAASARTIVEFSDGTDFVFDGTWAGQGMDTSWNGDWRITADRGTLLWSGDDAAVVQSDTSQELWTLPPLADAAEGLVGSLESFLNALDSGVVAENEIHDNLRSLSIVEAALASSRAGTRVEIAAVLDEALQEAISSSPVWGLEDVVARMTAWPSVRTACDAVRPGAPLGVSGPKAEGPSIL